MTGSKKQSHALPIYPTLQEAHRAMDAAPNPRDRMLILLLWATGGRVTEVINIRAGDITDDGIRMLNLKQHTPAEKLVFIPPEMLREVRDYCKGMSPEDRVIQNKHGGGQITRVTAWRIVTAAGRRAFVFRRGPLDHTLEPMSPWNYRHGNAVNLARQGVPLNAIQQNLGHSNVSTTSIYVQIVDPHRKEMIDRVAF